MTFRNKLLSVISIIFVTGFFLVENWKLSMENGDSSGYYFHLVAAFVNHDVGDYNQTIGDYLETYPNAKDTREDIYGIRTTNKGKYYIKYTLGVGVMQTPAFLLAHFIAGVSDKYEADGWSIPYTFLINFSKVIYILIGLYFLIGILERYFLKKVVALTVFSLAFATNLFYHGTFLTLAHSYLFFDFCLLIHLSIRFYETPNMKRAFGIGALVGLIALTRVPEVISLLVPLFWGVYSRKTLFERISFFKKNITYLLIALLGVVLVFSPQLFYWHFVSGELFFNPYQGETFNFFRPMLLKGWFSFKNGWLIYTPIMAFSLVGLSMLYKRIPEVLIPILLFVGLNSWIHYSYYVWNYYPGMGSRPMIESYPLLSFGLAAFFNLVWKRKIARWVTLFMLLFLTWLNLFQCWQIRQGLIWTENGNIAFYWEMFGKKSSSKEALIAYDSNRLQPDRTKLTLVDTLYTKRFEETGLDHLDSSIVFAGKYSLLNTNDATHTAVELPFHEYAIQPGDWMYVEVKGYRKMEDVQLNRDMLEELVMEFRDEKGKRENWSSIKIASYIGNSDFNIWSTGETNIWGTSGFFVRIPKSATDNWILKIYILNEYAQRIYLDDLFVINYR